MTTETMPAVPATTGRFINRNYARYWTGQAISVLGDFVFDVTLIVWIASRLAAGMSWAPIAVGAVLVAATLPIVILGPVAGVFVDRWDKRRTMLATDALRVGSIAALLLWSQIVPHLFAGDTARNLTLAAIYLTVFCVSVCSQFFNPSRMALVNDIVAPDVRTRASGMAQTSMYVAAIVGPPLAAPIFFALGPALALGFNAASYAISYLTILTIVAPHGSSSVSGSGARAVWNEFAAGIRFYVGNKILMAVLVSLVIAMLGAGSMNALDVFFVTANLHAPASAYGFVAMAFGSGSILGAVLATVFANKVSPSRLFWSSLTLGGVGICLFSRATTFPQALVCLFFTGMPIAALNVAIMPLILKATPREMLGRVSAVINPTINVASLTSIALAGWLAGTALQGLHVKALGTTFGAVDSIFLATGVLSVAGGLYAWFSLHGADEETPASAASLHEDESTRVEATA